VGVFDDKPGSAWDSETFFDGGQMRLSVFNAGQVHLPTCLKAKMTDAVIGSVICSLRAASLPMDRQAAHQPPRILNCPRGVLCVLRRDSGVGCGTISP